MTNPTTNFRPPQINMDEIVLKSAWLAVSDRTSKSMHLEPRQAEMLVAEHDELLKKIDRLADDVTILKTAYKKLFDEHKNCNAYVVFTDSQTVSREVD